MAIMGVRAYSRHRGCSHTAVQKAIKEQRLVTSLLRDKKGRPLIDSVKADIEWPKSSNEFIALSKAKLLKFQNDNPEEAHAAPEKLPEPVKDEPPVEIKLPEPVKPEEPKPQPQKQTVKSFDPDIEDATEGDDPGHNFGERVGDQASMDFGRARADKEKYAAKQAQIKYEKELGILVDAQAVEKKWIDVVSTVRTKILAISSKVRTRVPGLASSDYSTIERIVIEALQDLSDECP